MQDNISQYFRDKFGESPTIIVRAPGRVNLIGEHTDYNDGFVLPMAIDRAVWIALRPRLNKTIQVYSIDFNQVVELDLHHLVNPAAGMQKSGAGWAEYIKAVAWALNGADYPLHGWDGVVAGDVPIGGGLSSSAAMEMAVARSFAAIAPFVWNPRDMAVLGQKAENEWIGMKCGIMDQMISASGKVGHAMLLDCRSLAIQMVPLPANTSIIVMDTATRRELVDSAYNERRAQCQSVANFFGVPALRDVSFEKLEAKKNLLDPISYRRARHIITENERTLLAAEALSQDDPIRMGRLMIASHISLRDDFEVSRFELDRMVEIALGQEGCFGARMTGGGFGGCAVAIVESEQADVFAQQVTHAYSASTQLKPSLYVCSATNGAEIVADI